MLDFESIIQNETTSFLNENFGLSIAPSEINIQTTKMEFVGDYTVVVFPFVRYAKTKPEILAEQLASYLTDKLDFVESYSVVKGFSNLKFSSSFWTSTLADLETIPHHEHIKSKALVEFSSPNTNKPLHMGHIRNILLGWSCAKILEADGNQVIKTQIVNDRGIAICKSMLAYQKFGNGETPESSGIKGDFLIGKYYVLFDQVFKEEYLQFQQSTEGEKLYSQHGASKPKEQFFKEYKNRYFNEFSDLGKVASQMLLDWESGDPEIRALWSKMNSWVYAGFDETYAKLGIDFDCIYYESDTYLLGKNTVEKGLQTGIFYQETDGSVWVDLEDAGLDKKIVLRADGTSVYMTQDLGTAQIREHEHKMDKMVYVVGNEQEYHFQVLFEILRKLEEPYADNLHHLSYGMVELPDGKMKSREGTVVDADDLIEEVIEEAQKSSEERGALEGLSEEEKKEIYRIVGLGALKYFIIKVNPRKGMVFNPKESLDMQGQTGPYIQNAYVRIQGIVQKSETNSGDYADYLPLEIEIQLIQLMIHYKNVIAQSARELDPSLIANFSYELAKKFHRFYHEARILSAETKAAQSFRLKLIDEIAKNIKHSMDLLGIEMPNKM